MTMEPHSPTTCRCIVEETPGRGSWNMAVDEALLWAAVEREAATVRVYRWSEATVSLGYFQKAESAAEAAAYNRLPMVRRLSGGGAILHHHELTYSFALPARSSLTRDPPELYRRVHAAIIEFLKRYGLAPTLRGTALRSETEPFLCFGRGDERDIVCRGHKILGSAQRRRRGAIIQHGSLLLKTSPHASQFPGLLDLAANPDDLEKHSRTRWPLELAAAVAQGINVRSTPGDLTPTDRQRAEQLEESRYRFLVWD